MNKYFLIITLQLQRSCSVYTLLKVCCHVKISYAFRIVNFHLNVRFKPCLGIHRAKDLVIFTSIVCVCNKVSIGFNRVTLYVVQILNDYLTLMSKLSLSPSAYYLQQWLTSLVQEGRFKIYFRQGTAVFK